MAHDQQLAQFFLPDSAHFAVRLLMGNQDFRYQRVSPVVDTVINHPETALANCIAYEVAPLSISEDFTFGRWLKSPRLPKSNILDHIKTGRFHPFTGVHAQRPAS